MTARRLLLVLLLLGSVAWWFSADRWTHPAPGIAAPEYPLQEPVTGEPGQWTLPGGYHVLALANYHLHARVLGVDHYHYDRGARIAPVDLALGWGRMSDWSIYSRLNISQTGRYYLYGWGPEGPPIPQAEIITHSANNHIIPADDQVARTLGEIRQHDVIWAEGQLVEVRGPDGFVWRSSLTREDTGSGACELFRVTNLAVEPEAGR